LPETQYHNKPFSTCLAELFPLSEPPPDGILVYGSKTAAMEFEFPSTFLLLSSVGFSFSVILAFHFPMQPCFSADS